MFIYSEDEEEEKCIYTPKYGYNPLKSKTFDDHSLLGEEYYQYKPCKILFWTNIDKRITGIQTFFRNIIDSSTINSGENKGSESFILSKICSLYFSFFNLYFNSKYPVKRILRYSLLSNK